MLKHIRENEFIEDTIGILLVRPNLHTGNSILKSLNYFHHLTGNNIDFYLPGYGAHWSTDGYPDMNNVACINEVDRSFSYKAFVELMASQEEVSKWKYSDENELLLIPYHGQMIGFSEVGIFRLGAMLNNGTISFISSVISVLSRFVKHDNSVTSITARGVVKCVTKAVIEEIIDNIPTYISKPPSKENIICAGF